MEKGTKARGPGHPQGMIKVTRTPAMAYDIEEWMWGLKEDSPKVEVRNGNAINHRPEQRNAHSQCAGEGSRWHRRQGRPQFPRDTSGGSPSSNGGSSDRGRDWRFPVVNHDECPEKVTDQHGQEGVLG